MIYYVSHSLDEPERAREITRELQKNDLSNTYICPVIAFSHLQYENIRRDDFIELCLDVLSVCDGLIIASHMTGNMEHDLGFAKLVKLEVLQLEENGALRPFEE